MAHGSSPALHGGAGFRDPDLTMGDERTYEALMEHVRDCSLQRRRVEDRLASLERKFRWPIWLPFVGSVIVAIAVLVD